MKNREKLLKTASYDILLKMQENLEAANKRGDTPCIMNVIGAESYDRCNSECETCIAKWLNEESDY